jgi:DNA repair exonuclease SbcCD ATPase subunit
MPGLGPSVGTVGDTSGLKALLGVIADPDAYQAKVKELEGIEARIAVANQEQQALIVQAKAEQAKAKEALDHLDKARGKIEADQASREVALKSREDALDRRTGQVETLAAKATEMFSVGQKATDAAMARVKALEDQEKELGVSKVAFQADLAKLAGEKKAHAAAEAALVARAAKLASALSEVSPDAN